MTIKSDIDDINERLRQINEYLKTANKAIELANMSVGAAIKISKPKLRLVSEKQTTEEKRQP